MQNDDNQQDDSGVPQSGGAPITDDLEKAVHDLMNEFDLDEDQAKKL